MENENESPESTEKKSGIMISQIFTGSDETSENLHCLQSLTEFVKSYVVFMHRQTPLSAKETDGLAWVLSIISNDLKVMSEKL